jgi:hypothetical protein
MEQLLFARHGRQVAMEAPMPRSVQGSSQRTASRQPVIRSGQAAEAAKRIRAGADAIMELGSGRNIDGFDGGNGAALINHSRTRANCFLLREKDKVWLVAGVEGIKAGDELTYDYGSDYYPRKDKRAE